MEDKEFKITYIAPPISEIPKTTYINATSKRLAANKLLLYVRPVQEILDIEEKLKQNNRG